MYLNNRYLIIYRKYEIQDDKKSITAVDIIKSRRELVNAESNGFI